MSDTPRTDDALKDAGAWRGEIAELLCRELERELAQAQADVLWLIEWKPKP